MTRCPFTSRSAWLDIQSECLDLRRTHAHLKQGTRPFKKLTNIKDVKRYLSSATFSKDGLLVVPRNSPLSPSRELIIVPRSVLDGLVTALHIKLDHPSKHRGWLGRAMVPGSFQCRGVLQLWHMVGQGPAVLAAGAERVGFFFFLFFFISSILFSFPNASFVGRRLDILKYCDLGRFNPAVVGLYSHDEHCAI